MTEIVGQQSNSLNTARLNLGGAGTQTAALAFGGRNPSAPATGATELYDGNSWTSNPTGLNSARRSFGAAGTQTSALASGGAFSPTVTTTATEEWLGAGSPLTVTITAS
jgi:hypothetical protein